MIKKRQGQKNYLNPREKAFRLCSILHKHAHCRLKTNHPWLLWFWIEAEQIAVSVYSVSWCDKRQIAKAEAWLAWYKAYKVTKSQIKQYLDD